MKHPSTIKLGLLSISLAALVASLVLYFYVYKDAIAHADHAVIARKAVVNEADREKQRKDILALASSTMASRGRLTGMFVPADDVVGFIQAVEAIGPSSGAAVSISSINESASDASKRGTVGSLTAHIALSGGWDDVMNALELFETLPYKVKIDRLTLDTSIGSSEKGKASVRVWQAAFDISAATLI